jgi:DNA-binding MarR family transcriptional regulator
MWAASFGRRSTLDYAEMKLLDAVRSATDPDTRGATVGEIAQRLGIDPSRASRMVASAVKRGTLQRRASQSDGRKVILEVTARGAQLQAKGSDLTRARITLALAGWSRGDRDEFARLFARFAKGIVAEPREE